MKYDIRKWNYDTHEYDEYTPPKGWEGILSSGNMDLLIVCASCGNDLIFGDSYTSRELHTKGGFGYPVCSACYKEEIKHDLENMKHER